MSEYQYYEFQAVDRPLDKKDQQALRNLSTRARITATSFTNHYEWGSFKGKPVELMKRWFDLHLYLANWGTRQLMIRLPKRLIDTSRLDRFLGNVTCVEVVEAGENLILDICLEGEDSYDEPYNDFYEDDDEDLEGQSWLAGLASLRSDVLAGDQRLFYLLWLMAVDFGTVKDEELEPLPGLGPMSASLHAFANFFRIDSDLVEVAAERSASADSGSLSVNIVQKIEAITAIPEVEKTALLLRLLEGDPHVAIELRSGLRKRLGHEAAEPQAAPRPAGELRARVKAMEVERERRAAAEAEAARKRKAEQEARDRREHLDRIAKRGERVWSEIEAEIALRNANSYARASSLLFDLHALARERGESEDFYLRLHDLRLRHARKDMFLRRLDGITEASGGPLLS